MTALLLLSLIQAPVVVLAERGLPYYQANQAVTPRAVAAALSAAGIETWLVDADGLTAALAEPATRVLVNVYGSSYPAGTDEALLAFAARGGHLVSAGVPFSHPCEQQTVGAVSHWRDLGYRPLGERIALGSPSFVPEAAPMLLPDGSPPADLRGIEAGILPGARVHWGIDPGALPAGARLVPFVGRAEGGRTVWPVAGLELGQRRVFWAGAGDFADPRRPRQIAWAARLLAFGAAWCLDRRDAYATIATALPLPEPEPPAERKIAASPLPAPARVERVEELLVCDVRGQPRGLQQAVACLQGLANRAAPRVYLVLDEHDEYWLREYEQQGWIRGTASVTPAELPARLNLPDVGVVLSDAASYQAAVTLAGLRGWLVGDEAAAGALGLAVAADLRGRFSTRAAALAWAIDELLPACAPATVCHLRHISAPLPLDYLVAERIFCYWIAGELDGNDAESDPPAELAQAERLYRRLAAPGAVLGWWGAGDPYAGIGEYLGMSHASEHGLVTLGTEFSSNLSLLSRVAAPLRRRDPAPAPEAEPRIYVAPSVLESGNDPWYWQRHQRTIWLKEGWDQVPVSWCLGPLAARLQAPLMSWYFDRLPAGHELFCAVSGLGYMHAPVYAAAVANRAAVTAEYWRQTEVICAELGLRAVHLYTGAWGEGTLPEFDVTVAQAAAGCPSIATWLTDLGRPEGLDYAASHRRLDGGVPLFRCLTRWVPWTVSAELGLRQDEAEARALAAEIRSQTPPARPAYLIALVLSWSASPEVVRLALAELGDGYRAVTVGQLGQLHRATP